MAYPDGTLISLAETIYEHARDDFDIRFSTHLKRVADIHAPLENDCSTLHDLNSEEYALCFDYQSAHELAVTWLQIALNSRL